ncbi:MAG: adenosylcobalamin-dependent ribonucleoside-diphosphate reductase [Alphaproteobacteria bacterium]|nr:adenosylcobalamin-dependent ribonucleoside-diphosphate reductase [Alphaproteobacteria bacterium]
MQNLSGISRQIWDLKYRLKTAEGEALDETVEDTWGRVAMAVSAAETTQTRKQWAGEFTRILEGFKFLPAGRVVAGAGSGRAVTLFNCFVMGTIEDDMGSIFDNLKEAALTMQQGGGIGHDFSTLRPAGAAVKGVGADASGPVSFMDVWDAMCRTIMSAGARRGAMMATLRCDHPDIEAFIEAKRDKERLRNFNLSVLVTDPFMEAVKKDEAWDLVFNGKVYRTVSARGLWDRIMASTYAYAEPGVIFIDRINQRNNLYYAEQISATNPCGEQPLPAYGACLLGSVNLARLIKNPFTAEAALDETELDSIVRIAVRFLDDVVDVSNYPLPSQEKEAKAKRRIGLGVTGLADALIMCRARYGQPDSINLIERWFKVLRRAAYLASADIAAEKGPFPLFDREKFLSGKTVATLDADVRQAIADKGIRNALLTSIAPTGTISLLADNVSSGIEPVFAYRYARKITQADGSRRDEDVEDYAYKLYREQFGDGELPGYFVNAQELTPEAHLAVQAAAQKYIDSSISKTVNCPRDISFEAFKSVYMRAYELDCKGCTTWRPNEITGAILSLDETKRTAPETPSVPLAVATAVAPSEVLPPAPPQRPRPPTGDAAIVYMTKPLDRPEALPGTTYKLRWPETDHAIYITMNDIIEAGRRRPFEIFINSKNMEHYAWTVALTRMISAVFRRGGDVSFVVEELKAVFDPRGGQWMNRQYVPSLLAAIGGVIEEHMVAIGFLGRPAPIDEAARKVAGLEGEILEVAPPAGDTPVADAAPPTTGQAFKFCPRCSNRSFIRIEGCDTCMNCGYSRCS